MCDIDHKVIGMPSMAGLCFARSKQEQDVRAGLHLKANLLSVIREIDKELHRLGIFTEVESKHTMYFELMLSQYSRRSIKKAATRIVGTEVIKSLFRKPVTYHMHPEVEEDCDEEELEVLKRMLGKIHCTGVHIPLRCDTVLGQVWQPTARRLALRILYAESQNL